MAKGHAGEADFYRARAIDMMKKAQSAPSEVTRQIYLDLAQKWTEQADSLQNTIHHKSPGTDRPPGKGSSAGGSSSG